MCGFKKKIFKLVAFLAGISALSFLTTPLLSDVFDPPSSTQELSLIQATRDQLSFFAGESKTVLKVYDDLMEVVFQASEKEGTLSSSDVQHICAAIVFAADQHQSQTRKNAEKTPYICHPLEVTYDLMKIGKVRDVSVIIGSLLHDTPSQKKTTLKDINKLFGSKVSRLVGEVGSHPISAVESHQRDLMVHAPDQSEGTVQIELADLLYSVKELSTSPPAHWKKERIDHFFEWAQSVLDRFPNANQPLHDAIQSTIQGYWDKQ